MAVKQLRYCDLCQTDEGVEIMVVAYGKDAWEVDLCASCFEEQTERYERSKRRTTRSTIKPQHRFKKTEVKKVNL